MAIKPAQPRHPSRAGRTIELIATGLGESVAWLATRGVLFAVFLVIWVGVGVALIASPSTLTQLWEAIGALPLIVQVVVWLLFLPVMAGLWVWQASGWPDLVKLALVIALAGWTLIVMKPPWPDSPSGQKDTDAPPS